MENKKREKMLPSQRAKQFMPFAALTGLDAALRKKEEELGLVAKPEISDEEIEELNCKFNDLEIGDIVKITYYDQGNLMTIEGSCRKIDITEKIIMVEEESIDANNIIKILTP